MNSSIDELTAGHPEGITPSEMPRSPTKVSSLAPTSTYANFTSTVSPTISSCAASTTWTKSTMISSAAPVSVSSCAASTAWSTSTMTSSAAPVSVYSCTSSTAVTTSSSTSPTSIPTTSLMCNLTPTIMTSSHCAPIMSPGSTIPCFVSPLMSTSIAPSPSSNTLLSTCSSASDTSAFAASLDPVLPQMSNASTPQSMASSPNSSSSPGTLPTSTVPSSCFAMSPPPAMKQFFEKLSKSLDKTPKPIDNRTNELMINCPDLSSLTEITEMSALTDQTGRSSSIDIEEDLLKINKILSWLCNKVEPLLPLTDNITLFNDNIIKSNNLLADQQKIISNLQEQLQGQQTNITNLQDQLNTIKQYIPNFTQQHYDNIQNEYEEVDPSINRNNIFNNNSTNPPNDEFIEKLYELDKRIIECEQYSRRENLIISGIPDSVAQKDLQSKVLEILGAASLQLRPDDIQACHRLAKPRNSRYPARVIVRFLSRKIVDFCLTNRERVQNEIRQSLNINIKVFENLCKANEEALRMCNWLKENEFIHDHFVRNGYMKIVIQAGGRPIKVHHPEYLRDKFTDIPIDLR